MCQIKKVTQKISSDLSQIFVVNYRESIRAFNAFGEQKLPKRIK
jgi:hypothetical protein